MEIDGTLKWLLDQLPEDELRIRHDAIEEQIQALIRTRNVLRMAIDARNLAAKIDSNGTSMSTESPGYRPGTTDAVRRVLAEAPYRTLTTKEIMQALNEHGWMPDAKDARKAVGATISRMVNRTGELESMGRARYRLREEGEPVNLPKPTASNRLFIGSAGGEAESKGA